MEATAADYIGPPAPAGSTCQCGRAAAARCDGCGSTFCRSHWWRHSHTVVWVTTRDRANAELRGNDERHD